MRATGRAAAACRAAVDELYRSIDDGRATEALGLFAADAVLEAGGRRNEGMRAIAAVLADRQARTERRTRHVLSDVRVTVDGDTAALSADLTVFLLSGPEPAVPEVTAHVDVRLGPSDGGWRIAALRSVRSTPGSAP